MHSRKVPRPLLLTGALALAVRLLLVTLLPDADTDAYGHFSIGRSLLEDPWNLSLHWVWLPGYHYLIALMVRLGATFTVVRAVNAVLQTAAPFLLYDLLSQRTNDDPNKNEAIALSSSLLYTLSPLPNLLATSAQAETTFALLILGCAWAIERDRRLFAGILLALACLVRYEAWGAVVALVVCKILWRKVPLRLWTIVLPLLAILGWILLHRRADGEWLLFLRRTKDFAGGVRGVVGFSPLLDALWLPVILPAAAMGPLIVLVPCGARRAFRRGWLVPLGVLVFLLVSYVGRGALGLPRYLVSLTPFACVCAVEGIYRLAERWPRFKATLMIRAAVIAMAITTLIHIGLLVKKATARAQDLRRYEREASQ